MSLAAVVYGVLYVCGVLSVLALPLVLGLCLVAKRGEAGDVSFKRAISAVIEVDASLDEQEFRSVLMQTVRDVADRMVVEYEGLKEERDFHAQRTRRSTH